MRVLFFFFLTVICSVFFFLPETCLSSVQKIGKMSPGFKGAQMQFIDNEGLFLVSNSSNFGFGFNPNADITSFTIVIIHITSSRVIWSANREIPVGNSDNFVFGDDGDAYIQTNGKVIWSTNTAGKGVSAMELLDSGNLVLVGKDGGFIWQSFSHPTNTLMPNQEFGSGSKLVSNPGTNLSFSLEIDNGDMILSAGFRNPQPYWAMSKDKRRIINKEGGKLESAAINGNTWRFFDQNKVFLWQFVFADGGGDSNATWAAVLEDTGFIRFYNLQGKTTTDHQIPDDTCSRPQSCSPYLVCHSGNTCQCPSGLNGINNCTPTVKSCPTKDEATLINAGENLSYSTLGYTSPSSKTSLDGCKSTCLGNCTCLAMFFDNKSGNCYLFDQIGSFEVAKDGESFESYVKVSHNLHGKKKKQSIVVVIAIVVATILVILTLVFIWIFWYQKKNVPVEKDNETSEEDNFLESISGMPVRFTYVDLQQATNNFSKKLGQGGFGSVYEGVIKDGTKIAVKQLEGIGQGKKEFRAEVSIIGGIHHHHLVRLKGFCAEGQHRLLVYEYMANGSLDRWIFKKKKTEFLLDWDTRYNIAVGTAKGLAYLHEDCDVKIVHCDIKPENVLLDANFRAKVSDFGLAKLMTREQSHVFTTLRGTRGYLAPEWITNYAISEKSDVYSFGMVLLEIIGGRKNYDSSLISEKSHFPSYAFRMMEEGKLQEIVDQNMKFEKDDERVKVAIQVALWCIQDDMNLRPPMTKVVQMLEGLCVVPVPPMASQTCSRLYSGLFKSISEEGTSSGPSDCNSDAYLSAVRLSGPR